MPRILNDIDYVKWKDPRSKTFKNLPPEPWALPLFEPLRIDDYYDPGEAAVPSSTNYHNSMALFRLFFDNKMLDQMAVWTNTYIEAHSVLEKDAPLGKQRSQLPTCRQELYAYFGVVIHMGITIELVVEDYWGPITKGAAYKVTNYMLKNRFKQLERYI